MVVVLSDNSNVMLLGSTKQKLRTRPSASGLHVKDVRSYVPEGPSTYRVINYVPRTPVLQFRIPKKTPSAQVLGIWTLRDYRDRQIFRVERRGVGVVLLF